MVAKGKRELDALDQVFKALDHAVRRHILIVIEAKGGAVSAGQIARRFAHSWPTTSRHLKVLIDAELLDVTQEGRERYYVINRRVLHGVGAQWFEHFNQKD